MEILWWLAPAGVVTVAAMLWVWWVGRERRGEVDRGVAAARLARALSAEPAVRARPEARTRERSTGIAVRPLRDPVPAGRDRPGSPPADAAGTAPGPRR